MYFSRRRPTPGGEGVSISLTVTPSEFRFSTVGVTTQTEWMAGIRAGLTACEAGSPRALVFECNGGGESRTTDQLREIVDLVGKHRAALRDRCAVLVSTEVCYGAARMFGVFMEPLGFDVLVTADRAEADRWVRGVMPVGPTAPLPTATAGS
jgi:hypothetical protein